MSFTITHRDGRMESDPPGDWLAPLLAELRTPDDEHPDIAVGHETGWSLSAFPNGLVLWENVEDSGAQTRRVTLAISDLRRALEALSHGDLDGVRAILASSDSQ
jgi:hypothetical protein